MGVNKAAGIGPGNAYANLGVANSLGKGKEENLEKGVDAGTESGNKAAQFNEKPAKELVSSDAANAWKALALGSINSAKPAQEEIPAEEYGNVMAEALYNALPSNYKSVYDNVDPQVAQRAIDAVTSDVFLKEMEEFFA